MATGKRIEIRLHPDGTITGETIGMKGSSCLSALQLLEALVDATVTDSDFTQDFYEQAEQAYEVAQDEVSSFGD